MMYLNLLPSHSTMIRHEKTCVVHFCRMMLASRLATNFRSRSVGVLVDGETKPPASFPPQSLHLPRRRPCWQMPPPSTLLALAAFSPVLTDAASSTLLAPVAPSPMLANAAHSLQVACAHTTWLPPHSLHRLRIRPCWQTPLPPQSLHRLRCRPCSQGIGSADCKMSSKDVLILARGNGGVCSTRRR